MKMESYLTANYGLVLAKQTKSYLQCFETLYLFHTLPSWVNTLITR